MPKENARNNQSRKKLDLVRLSWYFQAKHQLEQFDDGTINSHPFVNVANDFPTSSVNF
jgi:hypothetical protein